MPNAIFMLIQFLIFIFSLSVASLGTKIIPNTNAKLATKTIRPPTRAKRRAEREVYISGFFFVLCSRGLDKPRHINQVANHFHNYSVINVNHRSLDTHIYHDLDTNLNTLLVVWNFANF